MSELINGMSYYSVHFEYKIAYQVSEPVRSKANQLKYSFYGRLPLTDILIVGKSR